MGHRQMRDPEDKTWQRFTLLGINVFLLLVGLAAIILGAVYVKLHSILWPLIIFGIVLFVSSLMSIIGSFFKSYSKISSVFYQIALYISFILMFCGVILIVLLAFSSWAILALIGTKFGYTEISSIVDYKCDPLEISCANELTNRFFKYPRIGLYVVIGAVAALLINVTFIFIVKGKHTFVKFLMKFVSLLMLLLGVLLLVFGINQLSVTKNIISENGLKIIFIIFIAVGVLFLLASLFSLVGSCTQRKKKKWIAILILNVVVLSLSFLVLLAPSIMALVMSGYITKTINENKELFETVVDFFDLAKDYPLDDKIKFMTSIITGILGMVAAVGFTFSFFCLLAIAMAFAKMCLLGDEDLSMNSFDYRFSTRQRRNDIEEQKRLLD